MIATSNNIISSDFGYQDENHLQSKLMNNGIIRHSLSNEIRWTGRLITMTSGSLSNGEASGYHDLSFPADGTTINVQGGGTRTVVAPLVGQSARSGGILLNFWESLWYKIIDGTDNTSIPGNFLITNHTTVNTQITDDDWILVASRDDTNKIKWFNGDVTEPGFQFGGSLATTVANWTAMKQKANADGYFFSPAGVSTSPTAFGFTGGIRWMNGGASTHINNQGYTDVTQAGKLVNTVVYGVGGATNRTWRLMTAAEKPSWFGGALRGTNPIVPASTTVVDLNVNETLFYAPNLDGTPVNQGTWYVASYLFTSTPAHWLPVASTAGSYSYGTLQLLLGGVHTTLKAGDAKWMASNVNEIQRLHHAVNLSMSGERYTRWTTNPFFAGTTANGVFNSQLAGLMVSWDDNGIIYGIGEGYSSWGNQYTWIIVPPVGTQIPLVNTGTSVTRVVQTIGAHRYIPLGPWEALWFIPPAYIGGNTSTGGDFVITNYTTNHNVPAGSVLVAKSEYNFSTASTGNGKVRVRWADGQYTQPGLSYAVTGNVVEYDHAQGSGDWRSIIVAGQTPRGGTSAMPSVTGVLGPYAAPYNPEFIYIMDPVEPKGTIRLKGLIQFNGNVATANANIGFIQGVNVRGQPIVSAMAVGTVNGDNKPIQVQIRFSNGTTGGQNGIFISITQTNMSATAQNWIGAGTPLWLSLDNIILNHS